MTAAPTAARTRFSIQRTYAASIEEAWALWTTKSGIESWWGPEGFDVTVVSLDLHPGGDLIYSMTAVAPQQVARRLEDGPVDVGVARTPHRSCCGHSRAPSASRTNYFLP